MRWKLLGLAGLAGVAGTGVVVARTHRAQRDYQPDEIRERLHRRLAEVSPEHGHPDLRATDDIAPMRDRLT